MGDWCKVRTTQETVAALGYSEAEIAGLRKSGVI
jgi:hypothetical protein